MKLLWLVVIAVGGWRLLTGRWPWQPRVPGVAYDNARDRAAARGLLGLDKRAGREEILAAHRAILVRIHPDRGGTSEAVHAADAARDLLLAELTERGGGRW